VKDQLKTDDMKHNVEVIRKSITELINAMPAFKSESFLKNELFKMASVCDVVLDLHCDSDAIMHMYTHDRLWPQMADLAKELG
jgi:predicted deacylase